MSRESDDDCSCDASEEIVTLREIVNMVKLAAIEERESLEAEVEKLKKTNSKLSKRLQCKYCLVSERVVVLKPCRHLCLCEGCFASVKERNNKCPICNVLIEGGEVAIL